jgi:hypothetical protein
MEGKNKIYYYRPPGKRTGRIFSIPEKIRLARTAKNIWQKKGSECSYILERYTYNYYYGAKAAGNNTTIGTVCCRI